MNSPFTTVLSWLRTRCVSAGLLVGLCGVGGAHAAADYFYTNFAGALTITAYVGPGGNITIPASIDGLPVTAIGAHAFGFRTNLTGVTIPDSITNIGPLAFNYCSVLTNAIIGESVATIGDGAFAGTRLRSINIPNSVTELGDNVFSGCYSLSSIDVGPLNPNYSSIAGVVFDKAQTLLVTYPPAKGPYYTIPSSVTSIGDYAFDGVSGLMNVEIPDGVTNIGVRAFADSWLVTLDLPKNLFRIGDWAFSRCRAGSVIIPDTVTVVGSYAFSEGSLTNVVIGKGVTDIGEGAFQLNPLTSVNIPESVVRLGYAFSGCAGLTRIDVALQNPSYSSEDGVLFNKPKTVLLFHPQGKVGDYAVPGTVTNIAGAAFYHCMGVTNLLLPDGVTGIGDQAFMECRNLASVNIPDSVRWMGIRTFTTCTSLHRISIGAGITNIADQAFYACTRLTNVVMTETVNRIGNRSFGQCYSLTNITIPASVGSIGSYAFIECFALAGVFFQGNAPVAEAGVFLNAPRSTVYYLPGTTGWGATFAGRPAVLWNPIARTDDEGFGVRENGFGFNITGTPGIPLVIEAAPNPVSAVWQPLQSCTLSNGLVYFSDPDWRNHTSRVYRVRNQ